MLLIGLLTLPWSATFADEPSDYSIAVDSKQSPVRIDLPLVTGDLAMDEIYRALDIVSHNSYRILLSDIDLGSNPVLGSFVQLKRTDKSGAVSRSNAAVIEQTDCHYLLSTAGHSLLDTEYRSPVPAHKIEVFLGGRWRKALETVFAESFTERSDEWQDWALFVVKKPHCRRVPAQTSKPLTEGELRACQHRVQFACYHPDRIEAENRLQLEQDCSMILAAGSEADKRDFKSDDWAGYFSCKQTQGSSGCSAFCQLNGELRHLGVFSKGYKRDGETMIPQRVGGFRLFSGEYAEALARLRAKYQAKAR